MIRFFFFVSGCEQQGTLLLKCKEAADPVISISREGRLAIGEGKEIGGKGISVFEAGVHCKGDINSTFCTLGEFCHNKH